MKVMPFPGEDVNAEDTDGDGITDDEDVCIEEDYDLQYHESCLNMAGLRVPTAVEFSAADQAYMEMNEALGIRGNSNPTPDDPYEVSSYKDLAIKTCTDLRDYESDMKGKSNWYAFLGILVGVIGGIAVLISMGLSGPAAPIVGGGGIAVGALVGGWLAAMSLVYSTLADSADSAWETLCTNHRR